MVENLLKSKNQELISMNKLKLRNFVHYDEDLYKERVKNLTLLSTTKDDSRTTNQNSCGTKLPKSQFKALNHG
jgi:hypothetical protein